MKTKKYFIVPILALLAASCQDDMEGGTTTQLATGEEVKFGATLEESTTTTRTIYGDLTDDDDSKYPIYWVNGDEVIVTSPECGNNSGVGSATYSVSVDSEEQDYASSLNKTGDIGVRWGTNKTGTFYSVYPADNASFGSDYTTVTLTMPQQQDCDIIINSDGTNTVYPNMDACFMYAKTANVASGNTVNLKYIPISTAIRFTLQGPSTGDDVTITSINFSAPTGTFICGTFKVDLSSDDIQGDNAPTSMAVTRGYNTVSVNATTSNHSYLTLGAGKKAEMNVFLLLEKETTVTEDWQITIQTANGNSYTKSLEFSGAPLNPAWCTGFRPCRN